MIKGDYVRWESGDIMPVYGVILSVVEDTARVEFRNQDNEYKVITKSLTELTKIGSK